MQEEDNFYWKVKDVTRSGVCKKCHKEYRKQHYANNRQKYIAKAKKWSSDNGGRLWAAYKLTEEDYKILLDKYNGLCWSCGINTPTVVDHDHECCNGPITCGNCIRGLLCRGCNLGIGYLGDNISGVAKALDYLQNKSHKH